METTQSSAAAQQWILVPYKTIPGIGTVWQKAMRHGHKALPGESDSDERESMPNPSECATLMDVYALFDDPSEWLESPNPSLGGYAPQDLLGTDREVLVQNLLDGIKHGMVS